MEETIPSAAQLVVVVRRDEDQLEEAKSAHWVLILGDLSILMPLRGETKHEHVKEERLGTPIDMDNPCQNKVHVTFTALRGLS